VSDTRGADKNRVPVRATEDSTTLYSRGGRGFAVIGWLFCLGVPVTLIADHHYLGMLRYGGIVLLAALLVWILFWAPYVTIAPSGVTVRNLIRIHEVSWPAIQLIDTKYALNLTTSAGKIVAWAAPAPGRLGTLRTAPAELRDLPESSYGPGHSIRPGDIPRSDSGHAALWVRRYWEQLRNAGYLDSATIEGRGVVTHWLTREILGIVGLAVVAAAGILFVRY
jgi:hypothetical protein